MSSVGSGPQPIDLRMLDNYLDGIGYDLNSDVAKSNTTEGKQKRDVLSTRVNLVSEILKHDMPSLITGSESENDLTKLTEINEKIESINQKIGTFNNEINKSKSIGQKFAELFTGKSLVKTLDVNSFQTTLSGKRRELLNKYVESSPKTVTERMQSVFQKAKSRSWAITAKEGSPNTINLYSKQADGTSKNVEVIVRPEGYRYADKTATTFQKLLNDVFGDSPAKPLSVLEAQISAKQTELEQSDVSIETRDRLVDKFRTLQKSDLHDKQMYGVFVENGEHFIATGVGQDLTLEITADGYKLEGEEETIKDVATLKGKLRERFGFPVTELQSKIDESDVAAQAIKQKFLGEITELADDVVSSNLKRAHELLGNKAEGACEIYKSGETVFLKRIENGSVVGGPLKITFNSEGCVVDGRKIEKPADNHSMKDKIISELGLNANWSADVERITATKNKLLGLNSQKEGFSEKFDKNIELYKAAGKPIEGYAVFYKGDDDHTVNAKVVKNGKIEKYEIDLRANLGGLKVYKIGDDGEKEELNTLTTYEAFKNEMTCKGAGQLDKEATSLRTHRTGAVVSSITKSKSYFGASLQQTARSELESYAKLFDKDKVWLMRSSPTDQLKTLAGSFVSAVGGSESQADQLYTISMIEREGEEFVLTEHEITIDSNTAQLKYKGETFENLAAVQKKIDVEKDDSYGELKKKKGKVDGVIAQLKKSDGYWDGPVMGQEYVGMVASGASKLAQNIAAGGEKVGGAITRGMAAKSEKAATVLQTVAAWIASAGKFVAKGAAKAATGAAVGATRLVSGDAANNLKMVFDAFTKNLPKEAFKSIAQAQDELFRVAQLTNQNVWAVYPIPNSTSYCLTIMSPISKEEGVQEVINPYASPGKLRFNFSGRECGINDLLGQCSKCLAYKDAFNQTESLKQPRIGGPREESLPKQKEIAGTYSTANAVKGPELAQIKHTPKNEAPSTKTDEGIMTVYSEKSSSHSPEKGATPPQTDTGTMTVFDNTPSSKSTEAEKVD